MQFAEKLIKGTIVGVHGNLVVDAEFDDDRVAAVFCSHPDRINKLYKNGAVIWVLPVRDSFRKVKFEAVIVDNGDGMVMVNPGYLPALFSEAFENGKLEDFDSYDIIEDLSDNKETRLTFRLSGPEKEAYAYVCGIHNKKGRRVVFPSFVDFREFTVYSELKSIRSKGIDTYFVILVIRTDCDGVKFSWNSDPVASAKAFDEARNGLKFLCYACNLDETGIEIADKIDIQF